MKTIKVKMNVSYATHSTKENGIVNLTLRAAYDQLTHSIEAMQMLNNDVEIQAKAKSGAIKLGSFRIKNILVDGDGESKLNFTSTKEFANLNGLNSIVPDVADDNKFAVLMVVQVEPESGGDDE